MPESPSTTTEVSAEEAKEPSVLKSPEIPAHDPEIEAFLDSAIDAVQEGDFETAGELAVDFAKNSTFWIDLGLIAACLIIAAGLYRLFRSGRPAFLGKIAERIPTRRSLRPFRLTLLFVSWIVVFIAGILELRCPILRTYSLILTCFVFINLPSKFIDWKSWMSVVSSLLFVTVALYILGLLDNTTRFLENYAFQIGSVSLSLLDLLKGLLSFGILMWFTGIASSIISRRLSKVEDLSPNVRVLFSKGIRLSLFAIAILVTMGVMGIQITTLAVFGGALGLGIGLGFQKVVSNMVSGIILLADKSIKPGDVIEIEETYGWINSVNLRYVSVITRDNKEHLIPNEDLITHPVINWSFSSKLVRVRAPFGISYQSDLRKAMKLAEECATSSKRVVEHPAPRCNLTGFGDSSVDFELRFWIEDPRNGVGVVRSEVLLAVWDAFHENGIEFPFPQRDVNLRIADQDLADALLRSSEQRNQPS